MIAVYPLGQALRRTSVLVTKRGDLTNFPMWFPCVELAIALEGSGNWPKSSNAEKLTGTAFLLAIARVLQKEYSNMICTASVDFLDICLNGRIFRCKVMCPSDDFIKRNAVHSTMMQGVTTVGGRDAHTIWDGHVQNSTGFVRADVVQMMCAEVSGNEHDM